MVMKIVLQNKILEKINLLTDYTFTYYCQRIYAYKQNLDKHKQLFSGNKELVPCKLCKKSFPLKRYLSQHMRSHKVFSCDLCQTTFPCSNDLTQHKKIHVRDISCTCDVCQEAFRTKPTLKSHKKIHYSQRLHPCEVCSKNFNWKESLTNHKQTHNRQRFHSCEVCSKTFKRKDTLSQHMRLHTSERCCSCKVCSKTFQTKSLLLKHMRAHTGDKPFSCDVCQKSYKRKQGVKKHKQQVHPELLQSSCDRNEESSVSNDSITPQKHIATCTSTGGSENSLKISKESISYCNACDKTFWLKSDMAKHMEIHMNLETFTCIICQKSFIMKGSLVQHVNLHTSEKEIFREDENDLSCFVCNKRSSLFLFRVDECAGIVLCDQCEQSSVVCLLCDQNVSISELRTHIRSHTGAFIACT